MRKFLPLSFIFLRSILSLLPPPPTFVALVRSIPLSSVTIEGSYVSPDVSIDHTELIAKQTERKARDSQFRCAEHPSLVFLPGAPESPGLRIPGLEAWRGHMLLQLCDDL